MATNDYESYIWAQQNTLHVHVFEFINAIAKWAIPAIRGAPPHKEDKVSISS